MSKSRYDETFASEDGLSNANGYCSLIDRSFAYSCCSPLCLFNGHCLLVIVHSLLDLSSADAYCSFLDFLMQVTVFSFIDLSNMSNLDGFYSLLDLPKFRCKWLLFTH